MARPQVSPDHHGRALDELPDWLSIAEVARYLGVARSTAYQVIDQRRIPVVRLGRRIVVPKARLSEVLLAEGKPRRR